LRKKFPIFALFLHNYFYQPGITKTIKTLFFVFRYHKKIALFLLNRIVKGGK